MLGRARTALCNPVLALAASVVLSSLFLVRESRRLYFSGDDWAFLLGRRLTWQSVMAPHNEHWSALPVIAFRTMVHVFGIGHYPAYALMPIILHAGCCAVLYLVMRRNGFSAWPVVIVTVPFAFLSGNLAQNPLWDFQIGFLGSAVFGLLSLLSAIGDRRRHLVLSWLAMVGSFLCSGMAILMLVWLGLYVLLTRGLVRALTFTVPPGLVYVAWYVAYGHEAKTTVPRGTASQYVDFVTTGLSSLWQQVVRLSGTGGVILLVLLAVAWLGPLVSRQRAVALSGMLSVVALFLFIGYSRSALGGEAATVGRYAYFGIAFSLPAAAATCTLVARRLAGHQVERVLAAVVIVVLLVGNGVVQTRVWTHERVLSLRGLKGVVAATAQLAAEHVRFLTSEPSPLGNPDITTWTVALAVAAGELHTRPASRQALLDAGAYLQVADGARNYSLPAALGLRTVGLTGTLHRSGCSELLAGPTAPARLFLPPTTTGSQILLTSNDRQLAAYLTQGSHTSHVNALPGFPGRPTYVATTAAQSTLRLDIKPGPVSVCLGAG